jgi:hypothetical protein
MPAAAEGTAIPATREVPPTENTARAIRSTALVVDAAGRSATATITWAGSAAPGATLEIGDLDILDVRSGGAAVPWADRGTTLDLGLPASSTEAAVVVHYRFRAHENLDGASAAGYTFTWPYHCGNLFPCHALPASGADFSLQVNNAPAGQRVIPASAALPAAPSYQVGWAIGPYADLELGRTAAGTRVVASYLPGQRDAMQAGTQHLPAAFDWLESTLGPYRFGPEAGPVAVAWPAQAYGGMEHHPRWHVSAASLADEALHVHEAAHGWFGNGVRLACWEDFVLSEGAATYLAGRALEAAAPDVGRRVWEGYEQELRMLSGAEPIWPAGCNRIDIVKDGLYTRAPYLRGAFLLRSLAAKLGTPAVDRALGVFYREHAGRAAGMQQLLDTVQRETGYDPAACAAAWLRSPQIPAARACA